MDIGSKVYKLNKSYTITYDNNGNILFKKSFHIVNGIIDINDCVNVTRIIDPMLDDIDYIKESYILDVCSKEKGCE